MANKQVGSTGWCMDVLYSIGPDKTNLTDKLISTIRSIKFANLPPSKQLRVYAIAQLRLNRWRIRLIMDGLIPATAQEKLQALQFCGGYWHAADLRFLPYDEYLQSDHWKAIRSIKLEIVGGKCQLCNSTKALNVHHRSYKHLGEEYDHIDDLIVLCGHCHSKFHNKIQRGLSGKNG
jgi:hypothetical protein